MTAESTDIKLIFFEAIGKGKTQDRAVYLDQACGPDTALRQQVEILLQEHERVEDDFLESPPIKDQIAWQNSVLTEATGTMIGPYKLLEKIGEGGMAVVYMAQQTQPLKRRVALKIIKLGMDTREVIARFEAERQSLAIMNHPNIAKVLDAGMTESGRPYFVMELVKGVSITEYCDQNKLSTRERLTLFVPVCNAVHHAHQKGIIHRDLKPSNIMVTMHDGNPVPMVIDFGIAKATNRRLTERTVFTRYAQMIGTPEYMSPEQAQMTDMDIDIRTDIYSLGVVLYELLAGTSPFDNTILRRAALGEIQRIIREEEPLRPSTRISAMGHAAHEIAARRGTSVAELTKRLNRELEWIPLKAMRKDRTRRYTSASEFGDDVQNYLNDRPLLAGPESAAYRFRKAVHKYRVPVMAISVVIVTLIAGLTSSTSLYMDLRMARATVALMEQQAKVDVLLSNVQRLQAEGLYKAALEELDALIAAQDPGPKAHLVRAQLLIELGQSNLAKAELLPLVKAGFDIAGAAHLLLARVYLTTDSAQSNKHRQLAESLRPQTAEGFYLRGMTTASADEALTWLSRAVELDRNHYAARKARTFAYYNLKMYQDMARDADILIFLHDGDYISYALRAIALREMGEFDLALRDHAQAIELCTLQDDLSRLHDQLRMTLLLSGHYQAALEDSEQYESSPKFDAFKALTALGEYGKAQAEYKKVAMQGTRKARFFKAMVEEHVFELLSAGQPFDLPRDMVSRSPFFLMKQAAGLYTLLNEKARPVSIQGGSWLGDWSPDGQAIVYNRSSAFGWLPGIMEGSAPESMMDCIEIMDLASGKTHLLTRFGAYPVWSPDGKYIAFAQYNEGKSDVWLVPATGGEPQKLASGYQPQWSRDSQRVFFRGTDKGTICSINIHLPNAEPVSVLEYPGDFREGFSLSPDENLIAIEQSSIIHILTFPEGKEIVRWETPWPLQDWANQLQWHPDGKTIIINSNSYYNQMGMCLFNIERAEALHVLNVTRPWCRTLWSPDGSQLIIDPYLGKDKVWLMDIDRNVPLVDALTPALPTENFLKQLLINWGQSIEADPLDAENYVARAVVLMAQKDFDRAAQDLNQCTTLIHEPNDPACDAINFWADQYKKTGREVEAQLWALPKAQLAERFQEQSKAALK